jgi:hypothetical protein
MSKAPLISIVDDDALARDGIRELDAYTFPPRN